MIDANYQLAMSVTHADGGITRWGPDEFSSQAVPTGLSFTTSVPGGFKDMTCTLLRELNVQYPDQSLFDSVKVYGPGGKTAWEGRMMQFPREQADTFSVKPAAVGWSSHLKDDASFREIYVDRDLTHWTGPSVSLQLSNASNGFKADGPQVVADYDGGQPALQLQATGAWTATSRPTVIAIYNGHSINIDALYYAWKRNANISSADTSWSWQPLGIKDDSWVNTFPFSNLRAAGPGTGTATIGIDGYKWFAVFLQYATGPGGADNFDWSLYWTTLAIYGRHGLTKQGTASATSAQGFYASDIVAHIVSKAAPLLTYSTGVEGSISPTTFVIDQAAFLEPTTADDAIADINKYHLYEWGVYDNREFFWRPPNGPSITNWTARLSDGAQVSLEGDDANNIFNGVYVKYTDPNGQALSVGPPGSGANAEDESLRDTSETNPVNAHGIPRRWGLLDISQTTTRAGAIQIGAVWLAEHNLPTRRGQITLTGTIDHPTKGRRPVWEVRAGDTIQIAERRDDVPRRVIETSYDHDSRKLTASMDNTVFKLDAIMERMGIDLIGVI